MLSSGYSSQSPSAGLFHSHSDLLFAANIRTDIGKNGRKCIRWENQAKMVSDGMDRPHFIDWEPNRLDITRWRPHRDPWKDFSFFASTRDLSPFFSSFPHRQLSRMQGNNNKKTKAESECLARPISRHECVGVLLWMLLLYLTLLLVHLCTGPFLLFRIMLFVLIVSRWRPSSSFAQHRPPSVTPASHEVTRRKLAKVPLIKQSINT